MLFQLSVKRAYRRARVESCGAWNESWPAGG